MPQNHYILMADIRNSSQEKGGKLMENFKAVVNQINKNHAEEINSPLTITLGDEFQGIIKSKEAAITIIQDLEEMIIREKRNFKLRYVLHYGPIDTPINKEIAYGMLGSGLSYARQQLEELKSRKGERIFIGTQNTEKDKILNKIFFLYTAIIDDWKKKDLEPVALFLRHQDYKIVADKMGKDRSLLWKKEKSLRLAEYYTIKDLIALSLPEKA